MWLRLDPVELGNQHVNSNESQFPRGEAQCGQRRRHHFGKRFVEQPDNRNIVGDAQPLGGNRFEDAGHARILWRDQGRDLRVLREQVQRHSRNTFVGKIGRAPEQWQIVVNTGIFVALACPGSEPIFFLGRDLAQRDEADVPVSEFNQMAHRVADPGADVKIDIAQPVRVGAATDHDEIDVVLA